jgi:hypothetical protein
MIGSKREFSVKVGHASVAGGRYRPIRSVNDDACVMP